MDNLHKVKNIFISDGSSLASNNAAITATTSGKVGVYGSDWTALNPAGGDTITTQPSIYIVEGKTNTDGDFFVKKSSKIDGSNVINYSAESYAPAKREVWSIGYNRKTATGTIELVDLTNYTFSILFNNDKHLFSERPSFLKINFTSPTSATKLGIATTVASSINNSSFNKLVTAIVVGNGTGVYGVTSATEYGVEITAKDINQMFTTTYTPNKVYFKVSVDDASGFGTTTTCTQIQAFNYGNGTYDQVYSIENYNYQYEGVLNRRLFPIPQLDYSSSSALTLSAAITPVATGTSGQDTVTFDLTIAAILTAGEKVEIDGVNYEIKYIRGTGTGVGSANAVVLTTPLTTSPSGAECKVRYKYDIINIEFNDSINTPTGVVAVANKSVMIAVPAIDAGDAYTGLSNAGTNLKAILDGWMTTTPRAFANISI